MCERLRGGDAAWCRLGKAEAAPGATMRPPHPSAAISGQVCPNHGEWGGVAGALWTAQDWGWLGSHARSDRAQNGCVVQATRRLPCRSLVAIAARFELS